MACIHIEVTQEGKHAIIPHWGCNITSQQVDHVTPTGQLNPAWVKQAQNGRCVDPISVMEMMIVERSIRAKSSRVPDQGAPVIVVVKHVSALVVGRAVVPVLQLILEAALQAVQRGCVSRNFRDWQKMGDPCQILTDVVGVGSTAALAYREVIRLVGYGINQGRQSSVIEITGIWLKRKNPMKGIDGSERGALQDLQSPARGRVREAGINGAALQGCVLVRVERHEKARLRSLLRLRGYGVGCGYLTGTLVVAPTHLRVGRERKCKLRIRGESGLVRQKRQRKVIMSAGKITGKNCAANSAPSPAGRAKQTIVIIGDAHTQNVGVVAKYRGLPRECNGGIAAGGSYIDERHSAPNPCRYPAKIEIHCPIRKGAYVHAGGIQAGDANSQITLERLLKKSAAVIDRGVKSHQKTAARSLHAQRMWKHVKRTAPTASKGDAAVNNIVRIPIFRRPEFVRRFRTSDRI